MLGRVTARRSTLDIRRCCACGYGGHFAQVESEAARRNGAHCPRCGCDFAARPPRSYAEMEGLDEGRRTGGPDGVGGEGELSESAIVERWLVVSCFTVLLVAIGFVLIAGLFRPVMPA